MQNPNEDTEWNDILRAKGIIGQKEGEITEDQLLDMAESIIKEKSSGKSMEDMNLDELDELEDDMLDDERVILEYRMKRMAEIKQSLSKELYGELIEISQTEFVKEVSEASKNVSVVTFLYKEGLMECKLMHHHLTLLAQKYKATKFISIVGDKCIPNYPDKNLPTILIYGKGELIRQQIGLAGLGGLSMTTKDLEKFLQTFGAIPVLKMEEREDSDQDD